MTPNCVSRFAPSPTGRLHLGHAYSALLAQDLACAQGGAFVLRIEDIDETRCRPEFVDRIFADLAWLGLDWEQPVLLQSTRRAAYQAALEQLIARGLAYKCWCTRAEIAAAAGAPQGDQPLYPGTCRGRADPGDGRPFCWRLDCAAAHRQMGALYWHDQQAGRIMAQPELLGDVVIARKDAGTSYHIAVVVDDAAQGVTDVVRGQDLFEATHIHRLLQALLGLPVPLYHHHRLILDAGGERLAKRRNSETLADLQARGADPIALVAGLRRGALPPGYRFAG
ncbi:MAG: tRNA glutamyl-Q(34) synthetase GluQRS [Alphaproteobacteria bacterium]|nr:tRNA glutamyl-Q(34) synthetase GluQRS [Alphaproteobacteria bacterium]